MSSTIALPSAAGAHQSDIPSVPIWRLSVADFHAMIDAGIFKSGDPVEFLEGWLVKKMTKYPPHELSVGCTADELTARLPNGWHVRTQGPVTTDNSEPEPDISVVRGSRRDYADRHPGPADLGLVVEVADASLGIDRGQKKRIYAAASIPVYWIINLVDHRVEVYSVPSATAGQADYKTQTVLKAGDQIPLVLEDDEVDRIAVSDLLP